MLDQASRKQNQEVDDLLLTEAIPRADMEGLEGVAVVARKARVTEPALRVVREGVGEVLIIVVHGPLVDSDDALLVILWLAGPRKTIPSHGQIGWGARVGKKNNNLRPRGRNVR